MALSTIGRYLRSWGFSPQKPVRRAYEQNRAQVQYWLQTKYPAIKQQAKEAGATGWMAKPFEPQRMLDIVGQFI